MQRVHPMNSALRRRAAPRTAPISAATHRARQLHIDGKRGKQQHIFHHHHRHGQRAERTLAIHLFEHCNLQQWRGGGVGVLWACD